MSILPRELDCSTDYFKADSDIAGLGVISAFLVSAWISVPIIAFEYLFVDGSMPNPNRLDKAITDIAKIPFRIRQGGLQSIEPAVLMVSDQQLITGISMMSVGFITHDGISQYHFYIVRILGYVSFIVHQASVGVLHAYLFDKPAMRILRAVLMTVLFCMVLVGTVVIYYDEFFNDFATPTQCIWNNMNGNYNENISWLVVDVFFLVMGYMESMSTLYPKLVRLLPNIMTALEWLFRWIRKLGKKRRILSSKARGTQRGAWLKLITGTLLGLLELASYGFLLIVFAFVEILRSDIIDLWRNFSLLLAMTVRIFHLKADAYSSGEMLGSESEWTFGQIVPLMLLLLPIMSLVEIYYQIIPDANRIPTALDTPSKLFHTSFQDFDRQPIRAILPVTAAIRRSDSEVSSPVHIIKRRQDSGEQFGGLDTTRNERKQRSEHVDGRGKLKLEEFMYQMIFFKSWLAGSTIAVLTLYMVGSFNDWPI